MCLENKECLRALRDMDIVGYGGAQLPEAVGNALVANGVNLVSRFGSTECGCELTLDAIAEIMVTNNCSFDELVPRFQGR